MGILKRHRRTIIFSIIVIFVIGIIQDTNFSYAQENGESLTISSNFQMIEFSDDYGIKENLTSVKIDIPSSNWTITEIDVNFTSIKMGCEVVIIEEEATGFETIRGYHYEILGMQLNITEPTTIYSTYIFGYKKIQSSTPSPVYVQIEGWDSLNREPNGVIYGDSIILNMTEGIPQWNIQKFPSPIYLSSGFYCLVLDGTGISWYDRYYWYINNDNPTSQLYMCRYDDDENQWENRRGDVFLHKIVQQVNRSYFPSEINMTAEIDGNSYNITDGVEIGTGILSIRNLDFSPPENTFTLFIKNNLSIELVLNFSYHISLKHIFFSEGSASIGENLDYNNWIINPDFTRVYSNYSIKFYYPKSWYNLTIYRDIGFGWENIIIDIIKDPINYFIFLPNNTIIEGSDWKITANSPNVDFAINAPKTKFEPLQDLKFSVLVPVIEGNITYVLIDPLGFEEYRETKQVTSQEIVFSYNLSANPNEGTYKAYLFWYNSTDAGVKTKEFLVNVPFTIPPEVIFIIVLLVIIALVASLSSYVSIKRIRRIRNEHRQKIFNKYMDILNLKYLIISEKNSGLTVYDQFFAGKNLESSLISGFLQAVRAFGIELTDAYEESRSVKLDYQNSKILMSDFKNTRLIFLMEEKPSKDFLDSINVLLYDIEEKYGILLEDFNGDLTEFYGIKDLLEQRLHTSLIYPLKVITQNRRIKSDEKTMINRALEIMKEKNTDYFFVSFLLAKKKGFQVRDAETILKLINKKIFQPII